MNKIEVADGPGDLIPDIVKSAWRSVGEWYNRTVEYYDLIPGHLHQNPSHAFAVFLTVNAIFFYFINEFALYLEERVESAPRELDGDERKLNQFLINGLVVGGAMLIFNIILSKLLSYPLSKSTLAAIVTASIAIRVILGHLCGEIPDEENTTPPGADGANGPNKPDVRQEDHVPAADHVLHEDDVLYEEEVPHDEDVPHEDDQFDDFEFIDENEKSDDIELIEEEGV